MIELSDVQAAQKRIAPFILPTPLVRAEGLDQLLGCQVYLKLESLQRTGSFKLRGATNAIACLSEEQRRRGVVACSSGNHAQGVAYAARANHISAVIVMPVNANPVKRAAAEAMGARIVQSGLKASERDAIAQQIREEEGRTLIHPYADDHIKAGQGTIGLEILEQQPDITAVVCPVGGGGLISGVATAIKGLATQVRVIGAEPAGAARYAASLQAGEPVFLPDVNTIADGTRTDQADTENFRIISQRVDQLAAADDAYIRQAMALAVTKAHIVAEPSSVMGLAACLQGTLSFSAADKVCFVISGGNNDPALLAEVLSR